MSQTYAKYISALHYRYKLSEDQESDLCIKLIAAGGEINKNSLCAYAKRLAAGTAKPVKLPNILGIQKEIHGLRDALSAERVSFDHWWQFCTAMGQNVLMLLQAGYPYAYIQRNAGLTLEEVMCLEYKALRCIYLHAVKWSEDIEDGLMWWEDPWGRGMRCKQNTKAPVMDYKPAYGGVQIPYTAGEDSGLAVLRERVGAPDIAHLRLALNCIKPVYVDILIKRYRDHEELSEKEVAIYDLIHDHLKKVFKSV